MFVIRDNAVNVVYCSCSCNREREKFIKAVSIHCLGLLERCGYSEDNQIGMNQ